MNDDPGDGPLLELTEDVRGAILDHARAGRPEEVCGVLGGRHGEEHSVVTSVEAAENVAPAPRREYEIAPTEVFESIERIEDDGDDVVGFYHSHPRGPAEPSATDRRQAAWPGYSYVIAVLASDPTIRSWRWTGEAFVRERLILVEES